METPIFIVGLPRSGSTLWLNIFAQNPDICIIEEMLYLTPWRKDFKDFLKRVIGDEVSDKDVAKMLELMFSGDRIPGLTADFWNYQLGNNDSELKEILCKRIRESDRSLESIFKILIEEVTAFKGQQKCCSKFPVYVNHVPELLKWYPNCKIIHIIRDPRAIAISSINDPGGAAKLIKRHPHFRIIIRQLRIVFVIVQYIWASRLHTKYKAGKNYALFKYEDLIADPEKVVKDLCAFSGIDFNREMLVPGEGQASSVTGEKQKGFNKSAASHWRKVIAPLEETIISLLTKGSMRRFEYDPARHPVYQSEAVKH
jgi:hypothetical protein